MPECQGQDCDYQHQTARHEFLGLPQPDGEHDQQRGHDDVRQRAPRPGANRPGIAVTISAAAETADVISDTLLPAFRNPINPPTSNRTI